MELKPERLILLVGCITLAALAAQPARSSTFEVRLVLDSPSADSEQMAAKSPDGQSMILNIQKTALLDESDVQSAAVAQDAETGQPRIHIMFNSQGQTRLAEVSRQNLHRRVAVVIDGRLWEALIIQSELTGGAVPIQGDFSQQQALELAAKINSSAGNK
jgi:preprotein translocase subunit SecD